MKRRLLIIAVFLLLGAVVNVAVAWGCEMWAPVPPTPAGIPIEEGSDWPRRVDAEWPAPQMHETVSSWGLTWLLTYSPIVPPRALIQGETINYGQTILQSGWPVRALEYEVRLVQRHKSPDETTWIANAGLVPSDLVPSDHRFRRLPIRPVWPGFAVNTVFHAVTTWLLICGPFVLRRFLRVRRGLCPKCAYPMGESSVCTECGGALAKRARTT